MRKEHFTHHDTIHLRDTDATGVLYFTEQLRMAQETLEAFLAFRGFPLGKLLQVADFFLPIVHVEADYLTPLFVGDHLDIELSVVAIGTSSFTLQFTYFRSETKVNVGTVQLIHVTVSKTTRQAIPIPHALLEVLKQA